MTWTEIRNKLEAGDAASLKGLCMMEAPRTNVETAEMAGYVDRLVAERNACETVEAWHARLDEVHKGAGIERLARIVEAVTGISDDEAFPTDESLRRIAQAAALRQRRPAPVPVDPALQGRIDLPLSREAIRAIVEAHVKAWLSGYVDNDLVILPTPVERYVRVRQWGENRFAARVRLFDGAPATIYVEGKPRMSVEPKIRNRGQDFFFHEASGAWMRGRPVVDRRLRPAPLGDANV